ncbi:MAG: exosortase H [Thermoanaerobaculia bacterium]|nr:exosortase H [Thermoanaerobaculia bacterium]
MAIGKSRKPGLIFVGRFLAALIVFYFITTLDPVNEHVVLPFTGLVVDASAFILRSMHQPIDVTGTVIRSPRFSLDVRNGCNGVEAMMVLAAAMLAFPATLRSRVIGLLAGSVAIQILNLVRVSSLVWLGEHHRQFFDFVHVGVWQSIVILAAVSMFVFWSWKFAERPLEARS